MPLPEFIAGPGDWLAANWATMATAIAVLTAGWILAGYLSVHVGSLLPRTRRVDETVAPFISQVVRYGILVVTVVIVLSQFGVNTTSILAVLGAVGLAIALALQGTLANLAAGIMMIWLRPFNVGEYIDAEGITGTIVEVGLFGTRLRTYDGLQVFAPNSKLWSAKVTNYSRLRTRMVETKVGIAYTADISAAREALLGVATDPRVLPEPAPFVFVDALGDSAVVLCLRSWVKTTEWWQANVDFREDAKRRLDAAGVEIPYNKLDVYLKEAVLNPSRPRAAKGE
jgi:small conductance mechanosensitive channel